MKKTVILIWVCCAVLSGCAQTGQQCVKSHPRPQAYDGWRLGVQTWSFKNFTLFEAIEKTRSLGLGYIQAFPGQKVSAEIDKKFGPELSPEEIKKVKDKLSDEGVSIFAFGVVGVPQKEAEARKLFAFAKDMNIETIVSEPKAEQFDLIEKLCKEYQIKLAIHNHPEPSIYWNPDTVLKVCQGRSELIGACADTGHWVRSGLDPIECLKKLEGRIIDVHIKEIADGHDVIWGTRSGRIKAILEQLHKQGFKGTFSIEYEYNWDNNLPEIRQSVEYYNHIASGLNATGWTGLFNPDLSNTTFEPGSWNYEEGVLARTGKGDLWTQGKYSNYILDFEFKVEKNTNSGIFVRAAKRVWLPWVEVQVEDSYGKPANRHICGGIYDIKAPTVNAVKPVGEWNRMTITASGPRICVVLNGQPVVDMNLNDWEEAGKNPDGSDNKFKDIAYKDLPREGFIGFQDHGTGVWYRNIRIKEL